MDNTAYIQIVELDNYVNLLNSMFLSCSFDDFLIILDDFDIFFVLVSDITILHKVDSNVSIKDFSIVMDVNHNLVHVPHYLFKNI